MDVKGVMDEVLAEALKKSGSSGYNGTYDLFMGFIHAIDWKNEVWLQGWLGIQLLLWVITILTRNGFEIVQLVIFCTVAVLVYVSEDLNTWGAENWQSFATQNYFDKRGVFTGAVYSMPLILLMLFQLLNTLYRVPSLLVSAKRAELKEKYRNSKKKD